MSCFTLFPSPVSSLKLYSNLLSLLTLLTLNVTADKESAK